MKDAQCRMLSSVLSILNIMSCPIRLGKVWVWLGYVQVIPMIFWCKCTVFNKKFYQATNTMLSYFPLLPPSPYLPCQLPCHNVITISDHSTKVHLLYSISPQQPILCVVIITTDQYCIKLQQITYFKPIYVGKCQNKIQWRKLLSFRDKGGFTIRYKIWVLIKCLRKD